MRLLIKSLMDWYSASDTFWKRFTRLFCRAKISGKNFTNLSSASWRRGDHPVTLLICPENVIDELDLRLAQDVYLWFHLVNVAFYMKVHHGA